MWRIGTNMSRLAKLEIYVWSISIKFVCVCVCGGGGGGGGGVKFVLRSVISDVWRIGKYSSRLWRTCSIFFSLIFGQSRMWILRASWYQFSLTHLKTCYQSLADEKKAGAVARSVARPSTITCCRRAWDRPYDQYILSWLSHETYFYGHSSSPSDSRRAKVSWWQESVHLILLLPLKAGYGTIRAKTRSSRDASCKTTHSTGESLVFHSVEESVKFLNMNIKDLLCVLKVTNGSSWKHCFNLSTFLATCLLKGTWLIRTLANSALVNSNPILFGPSQFGLRTLANLDPDPWFIRTSLVNSDLIKCFSLVNSYLFHWSIRTFFIGQFFL